jgi:hypothetical protein
LTVAEEAIREGHYREILAEIRAINGRVEGVEDGMGEIRKDAREARDAAIKLTERVGAQDVPAKLAQISADLEKGFVAARTDLVNTSDKITREMRDGHEKHDKRLEALEAWKLRVEGATGIVGWFARNAPWLLTALFAAMAALGFKDRVL